MAFVFRHSTRYVNPSQAIPDVVVDYDSESEQFYVAFVATGSGYTMERKEFVSEDFKYTDRIEEKLVSGFETDDDEVVILFSTKASNEVHMIWMANCDLF